MGTDAMASNQRDDLASAAHCWYSQLDNSTTSPAALVARKRSRKRSVRSMVYRPAHVVPAGPVADKVLVFARSHESHRIQLRVEKVDVLHRVEEANDAARVEG